MDKPGMNRDRPKCSKTVESDTNCAQRSVTHDPDTKVEPEICSNSPPTSCDHMKTFHANGEQPRCEISPACFSTTNLAKDIKADHNTKDLPRFPCTFPGCEKTYKNKRHISQHVKTDHAENPVRFPCTLCEKEFKTMSHLGRHSSTHTNEKPYKCTTCGRGFAQKSDLMHHEMTHLEKSARASFKCQFCPTTSFRRSYLQSHIRLIHENQRNYPCSLCEKKLASVQDFKRHVAARHSENKGASTAPRVQKPLEK